MHKYTHTREGNWELRVAVHTCNPRQHSQAERQKDPEFEERLAAHIVISKST